ncbi:MAG: hypothetical protein L0Z50_02300 [Verrucomicrobiales bacterium]|nr:hypothetical protein [Verrucomicrobiales bacterium]
MTPRTRTNRLEWGSTRSADSQSAVSQNCVLPTLRTDGTARLAEHAADCKSAIQQTASLRYVFGAARSLRHSMFDVRCSMFRPFLFALLAFCCGQSLSAEISFTHDALSRRIEKRVDGAHAKAWLWSDGLKIAAELDVTNGVTARFIYAGDANVPSHVLKGTNTFRLITDPRGSVRLVVNAQTGEIARRLDYDEWGRVTRDTNPGFQPFGFAGGLYDPDTGLVRFGTRDYDAQTARWTGKDPSGFAGGDANLFAYALSDPVNLVDPSGAAAADTPTARANRAPPQPAPGQFGSANRSDPGLITQPGSNGPGTATANRNPVQELRPPSATRNPALAEASLPEQGDATLPGPELSLEPAIDDGTIRNPLRCPPAKSGSSEFLRPRGPRKAIPPGPIRPPARTARANTQPVQVLAQP